MKKIILTAVIFTAIAGTAVFGIQEALAFGGRGHGEAYSTEHREESMVKKAAFLGVSLEEIKEAWKNRTLHELLEEKGFTRRDIWNNMRETFVNHMSERGLTDEEIAQRLELKEEHMNNMEAWRNGDTTERPSFKGHWRNR